MGLSDLMRAVFERSLSAGEADLNAFAAMADLARLHPGWRKHEPRMIEIGQGIDKGGASVSDYVAILCELAKEETRGHPGH